MTNKVNVCDKSNLFIKKIIFEYSFITIENMHELPYIKNYIYIL